MDKLLAKYVKIAEVDSGHILELDKSMENMRFMTNINDQYKNKSDKMETITTKRMMMMMMMMMMVMMMMMMMMKTIGTWVMMTMRTEMPIKEGDYLLRAVFLEEIIAGKYFYVRIVSMYKFIYRN
jgi:hypothetical protein